MTYELAKELKDAGFEQWDIHGDGRYDLTKLSDDPKNKWVGRYMTGYSKEELVSYTAIIPTLSELIEACVHDDAYFDLKRELDVWIAETPHGTLENHRPLRGFGQNPDEAVARLWLALNKK